MHAEHCIAVMIVKSDIESSAQSLKVFLDNRAIRRQSSEKFSFFKLPIAARFHFEQHASCEASTTNGVNLSETWEWKQECKTAAYASCHSFCRSRSKTNSAGMRLGDRVSGWA
jgi:hypothetical protein